MTHEGAHHEADKSFLRFCDLAISSNLKKGIKELGYTAPTAFQKGVFENFQNGKNVVGEGQSNYGKSLAFSLPILAKIAPDHRALQALVICENNLLADLCAKECRALGRHEQIVVSNQVHGDELPHVAVVAVDDLLKADIDLLLRDLHTIFFDGMSATNAKSALDFLLPALNGKVQFLIFGKDTVKAFETLENNVIDDAVFINNNDQPKITLPAKHIYHQAKDAEPKPRALLAVLEIHRPKNALITCTESQECDLLARYLARYGYRCIIVSEENNRHGIANALRELGNGSADVVICQSSLLIDVSLENVAFMVNYDMFDRPSSYEHATQFNKQADGLTRTIVNLLSSRELGYLAPIKAQCLIEFTEMPLPPADEVMDMCAVRIRDALNHEASAIELAQFESLADKIFADENAGPARSLLLRNHLLGLTTRKRMDSEPREPREPRDFRDRRSSRQGNDRRRDRRDQDGSPREAAKPREEREPRESREPREPRDINRNDDDDSSRSTSGTEEGITRLYVTLGRRDGLHDLASLAQYLSDKSGVDLGHFSGSGMIRDNSAHIEVDDDVAETLINALHNSPKPTPSVNENGEEALVVCERARQTSSPRQNRRPMRRRSNFQRRH